MIVILKPNTPKNEVDQLIDKITGLGVQVNPVFGQESNARRRALQKG